jgi:hypothetical protein
MSILITGKPLRLSKTLDNQYLQTRNQPLNEQNNKKLLTS